MKRPVSSFRPLLPFPQVIRIIPGVEEGTFPSLAGAISGTQEYGEVDGAIPSMSCFGYEENHLWGSGDAYMPGMSMEGLGGGNGALNDDFPSLSLTATEMNRGTTSGSFPSFNLKAVQLWDSLDGEIPTPTLEGNAGWIISGDIPAITPVTITGFVGNNGVMDARFPAFTGNIITGGTVSAAVPTLSIDATGKSGNLAVVIADIPTLTIVAGVGGGGLDCNFPSVDISSSGLTGLTGTVSGFFPRVIFESDGLQENKAEASCAIPRLELSASGFHSLIGNLDKSFSKLSISGNGYSGVVGSLSKNFPTLNLESILYQDCLGSVDGQFPGYSLYSTNQSYFDTEDVLRYSRC